ncbi:MAG: Holliday junction resolvase RuvX [Actinobacteria bacterium]|nr:Holliday junction resolvase RuvX [Actinomycetota bacterium]
MISPGDTPGPPGRVLGVDLGARRIGLALSDPTGLLAGPLSVLQRTGDRAADHTAILRAATENEAGLIVVGLPLSLSTGRPGPAAQATLDEVAELAERAAAINPPMRVQTHDERLTTVTAQRSLATGGVRAKDRRAIVDKVAAAVMLQAWLDGHPRADS